MKKRFSEKRKISSERRRLVEELHAPARRNFPRRRVIVRGYDLWQTDIVEMRPYSSFNRGHRRYVEQVRMDHTTQEQGWKRDAIAEIIQASGRCPKNLQTDIGKKFYNADVQKKL